MKRLDAALVFLGICSRSEAKTVIKKGKVLVNGVPVTDPAYKTDDGDRISVNGETKTLCQYVYIMLNKPSGIVSTMEEGTENVISCVPKELYRKGLFPVGRLDKDTSGLIFITNDGELSHRLTSPSYEVEKIYIAETDKEADEATFAAFENGMMLRDGLCTLPARLEKTEEPRRYSVTVKEGKYHQVRRMFAANGLFVKSLKRICVGGVFLDDGLDEGKCRELTENELSLLQKKP